MNNISAFEAEKVTRYLNNAARNIRISTTLMEGEASKLANSRPGSADMDYYTKSTRFFRKQVEDWQTGVQVVLRAQEAKHEWLSINASAIQQFWRSTKS
jgi:hypothetical protein